ncbi:heat shock protein beta-11-like [Carcharodon carcharias]|uniref:heat shock protein beta-11-like n=1 Tax=Carcharodon carcharias TaxID=13397 RepID=UPI001B7DC4BA|nr:heat shock protein beta-11-like [Carcharodon carcharias]
MWKLMEEARKSMNCMERVLEELTKEFWEEKPRNQNNKPDDNEEGFSPEELNVKVLGRKVLVTGKHEKKSDDGSSSSSYKYEEFRREFHLPEDVDAEALNCSLSQDGRLKVQAARLALPAVNEQTVPVNITSDTTTSPRLNPGQETQKLESGKYERKDEEQVKMDN